MKKKDWNQLASLLKPGELSTDEKTLDAYSGDKWFAVATPEAVALPKTTASVSKVLAWANQRSIPVTARGAGHGYVGGCVPVRNGIVLSLERMKRIREVHSQDFVAVVQAGVITADLQEKQKHWAFSIHQTQPAELIAALVEISPPTPEAPDV